MRVSRVKEIHDGFWPHRGKLSQDCPSSHNWHVTFVQRRAFKGPEPTGPFSLTLLSFGPHQEGSIAAVTLLVSVYMSKTPPPPLPPPPSSRHVKATQSTDFPLAYMYR